MAKVNKNLTIKEVEEMRSKLNIAIAEAIQEFEENTGMKVGYIDTVRKRDEEKGLRPTCYDGDQGPVVTVNASTNMDF